ncbi:hypothetical protein Goshw_008581, partial [Gossypium schwendimanii]|nr:hypothetical protein [Gossypium schwendimanii]
PTAAFSLPLLLISPAENQLTSVVEKKPHCTDSLNQTTQHPALNTKAVNDFGAILLTSILAKKVYMFGDLDLSTYVMLCDRRWGWNLFPTFAHGPMPLSRCEYGFRRIVP